MSSISKLGETINARIQQVADYKTSAVPIESGVITDNGGLLVNSLDDVIPSSDYEVLRGSVSDGDEVVVVWAEEDPIVIGIVGNNGSDDLYDIPLLCKVPTSSTERQSSTDALGNAIYDIGFMDVILS